MPWDGNGGFILDNGVNSGPTPWADDDDDGFNIVTDHHDFLDEDLAQGLENCLTLDGQNSPTANINWGGYQLTGLSGTYSLRTNAASIGAWQDGSAVYLGTAGGTADALTFSLAPAITAYVTGQRLIGRAASANATTTPTVDVNTVGALTVLKSGPSSTVALDVGDIRAGAALDFLKLSTAHLLLLNPASGSGAGNNGAWTDIASASTTDIGAVASTNLRVTGTTTITALGTAPSGVTRVLRFAAALTLTYNATSLIVPGAANITTAAGDTVTAVSLGSGNWVLFDYTIAALAPFDRRSPGAIGGTTAAAGTFTALTATGAVALSPADKNVVLSPTGTGVVTINPATAGTINNASIGVSTAAAGRFTTLTTTSTSTIGGTMTFGGQVAATPKMQAYTETKTAPSISSNTLTIDLSGSNFFNVSLNANITTFTVSNAAATGTLSIFTIAFTNDGTTRSITWGSAVKWQGGAAPTMTGTSGKVDTFVFYTFDGGTNIYAFISGQNA